MILHLNLIRKYFTLSLSLSLSRFTRLGGGLLKKKLLASNPVWYLAIL